MIGRIDMFARLMALAIAAFVSLGSAHAQQAK
jgi:hypothetical protein